MFSYRPPICGYSMIYMYSVHTCRSSWIAYIDGVLCPTPPPDRSQFGSPDQQSTRGQRGGVVRGRGRGRGFRENRGGRGTGKPFPGYNQGESKDLKLHNIIFVTVFQLLCHTLVTRDDCQSEADLYSLWNPCQSEADLHSLWNPLGNSQRRPVLSPCPIPF